MTDSERLDFLEEITMKGGCPGLINDDNGHWAVSLNGMQNVPFEDHPIDIVTTFFVEKHGWKETVREAIDDAHAKINR